MTASNRGHSKIAAALLEHGASPNLANQKGWTALMFAAREGQTDIGRDLLEHGADPNLMNDKGEFALYIATLGAGHPGMVSALLDNGADVDQKTSRGITALSYAAFAGSTEIVKLLVLH